MPPDGVAAGACGAGPIETVVVQPTPFCNINCSYCYLPARDSRDRIAQRTVEVLFEKLFASNLLSGEVTVIWHAGEPLVMPVAFYRTAFQAIAARRPASLRLRHSIQTNGMLITPEWCELFRAFDVGVGVSIDGPKHLHDAHRLSRSGKGTFDRTLDGIRTLRREATPFHVITVLSAASLDCAQELLDFYSAEGIEDVCFNVEESEGAHVSTLFGVAGMESRFRAFLERFWALARADGRVRFIREIDGMLTRVFRPKEATMRNPQVTPFGMVNVDCHGNVSSFSPELLGLKNAEYEDFIVGNILVDSLEEMLGGTRMARMATDIAAGVAACRQGCGYFSVCGGGAPINKLAEHGSFAATRTAFCALTQIVPTDLILAALSRMDQDVAAAAVGASRAAKMMSHN